MIPQPRPHLFSMLSQAHYAADLVKYYWFICLTLHVQIRYIDRNNIRANYPINQRLDGKNETIL